MKIWLLLWFMIIGLFAPPALAQGSPLLSGRDTIQFVIRNKEGLPFLDWIRIGGEGKKAGLLSIQWLELKDADLSMSYALPPLNAMENNSGFYYELHIALARDDGKLAFPPAGGGPIRSDRGGNNLKWDWPNALEDALDFNRPYRLIIQAELIGELSRIGLDCSQPHTFPAGSKAGNITIAAGALGLVGIGQAYRLAANRDYSAYKDRWAGGRPLAEAEPYYDKAQQEAMLSDALTWAGAAILLADVAWYGIRQKKRRRKEQLYQKYCRDKSENLSSVKWNLQPATGQAGIGLAVRF
ncbi:MAG: hypothetical protein KDC66_01965 [Phaeodactylibacter sp.]|nr:hypothetical protein [Phaeodactylibacter sp.]